MNPRVFVAGVHSLPALPDDLLGAYDFIGVRWHRNLVVDGPDTFSPDGMNPDPGVPRVMSWAHLVRTRGPLAESPAVGFLT